MTGRGIEANLKNLHFLQNQFLRLQVIFGQHNQFLNCSLVCRPQHKPITLPLINKPLFYPYINLLKKLFFLFLWTFRDNLASTVTNSSKQDI